MAEGGVPEPPPIHPIPPYFSAEEFAARLHALRIRMEKQELAACLISVPENIFYLTGLDHWGYFAPHLLLVPASGEMVVVARALEGVTAANQVKNARFNGHSDSETAADKVAPLLHELGLTASRIGFEAWSWGMSVGLAGALTATCPLAKWVRIDGMVDELRLTKSPAEQHFMREAARISDAAAAAAIDVTGAGASEREIAAACSQAMIGFGGTFPAHGPFIRSTARLGEEHTTWTDTVLRPGDSLFLELSGCVARYHAPLGRLIHVGTASADTRAMAAVTAEAFDAVVDALRPGKLFRDVYAAWQGVVDAAGLSLYRRHHCGYVVGAGFPPSWTGGTKPTGVKHDSDMEVQTGMGFHVLSWLMGTGRGDFFISNTVLLGEHGPEVLTRIPAGVTLR